MRRRLVMLFALVLMVLALAAPASAGPNAHIHPREGHCVELGNGGNHPGLHNAHDNHPAAAAAAIGGGGCSRPAKWFSFGGSQRNRWELPCEGPAGQPYVPLWVAQEV
jgi:hypothetical protein